MIKSFTIKNISVLLISFYVTLFNSNAQNFKRNCGSNELYLEQLNANPNLRQERLKLEQFTKDYLSKKNAKTSEVIYKIPVVVHVIHNGEAIGTGQNISDEQIFSQIAVLNKDFRLLNSDQLDQSHPFYNTIADCGIEFCLADKDQNGTTTTGINRYNYLKENWGLISFNLVVKPITAWDREKYLNIWVTQLEENSSGLIGYATFPGTNDKTDGVVIDSKYFGTTGTAVAPHNHGRTTTHEVGHYLNLFHIWGDDSCGTDFVDDTAPHEAPNNECPAFPYKANNNCGSSENGEMFMNYMDYVEGGCMNMFTKGQKERMIAALLGARASLLSSPACSAANGIIEVQAIKTSIYPNPAIDVLNISFASQINIKNLNIFDVNGHNISNLCNNEINDQSIVIHTENLSSGNYFVKIELENQIIHQQFMIIK